MVQVVALHSFTHDGKSYRRDAVWDENERRAEAFQRAGLVRIQEPAQADPRQGSGVKLSASPAAQASTPQTSSKSGRGGRRKKAEPSSSQTPPSE